MDWDGERSTNIEQPLERHRSRVQCFFEEIPAGLMEDNATPALVGLIHGSKPELILGWVTVANIIPTRVPIDGNNENAQNCVIGEADAGEQGAFRPRINLNKVSDE